MPEAVFDHDRLDVYRLAVDYTADSYHVAEGLSGLRRHARDQWLRAEGGMFLSQNSKHPHMLKHELRHSDGNPLEFAL